MRHRIAAMVLFAFVLAAAIPAFATEGLGVNYLNGTVKLIPENATGTLDITSTSALLLQAGPGQIAIPYSAISTYDYKEENRFRLGVLAPLE